ncbi:MAG: hypothetical protein JSU87_15395 [Gemmatimonadota bacterium]|nr:MAG: hypothetical protein JSU87_15395 [Gemmatimonadota bacterium]
MRVGRLRTAVSIAEIISALAVVVTLVYAVSELKRSRAMTSTDIETVLYDRMLEMDRLLVEADGFADIVIRVSEDPESLTSGERARYLAYEHIFFDAWEAAVQARKNSLMSQETFESWDDFFAADASRRPKLAWTGNLRFYGAEFIEYVEERVTRE